MRPERKGRRYVCTSPLSCFQSHPRYAATGYLATLREKLKPVALPVNTPLYAPFQTPKYAHFMTSGIASVITTMSDGGTAETGLWGRESLVESFHLLSGNNVPNRCFMQVAGTALRMPYDDLEQEFASSEPLRVAVLKVMQRQSLVLGQLVACNRLHEVEERLARWLLMVQDRVQDEVLHITQEFLAEMLGSRRTTVTLAAGTLQRNGLIEYQRGRVRILDRPKLEHVACECYPVIRDLIPELLVPNAANGSAALLATKQQ